jgi:hypothetical protein
MKITHLQDARVVGAKAHRSGNIGFRYLLTGNEGSADNYALTLVDVPGEYTTPRHRHNFEQVRIMLKGQFGFGPGLTQEEGSVGYFTEGSWYEQHGDQPSQTLLLQCGGPSGSGYMSDTQLQQGIEALSRRGRFHDGVYSWNDGNGKLHNQDGYEAVWEHVFGRAIVYAKPRYETPVILYPDRFNWIPVPDTTGLSIRQLGTFHERGLQLVQLRLDAGCTAALPQIGIGTRLLFWLSGSGALGDAHCEAGAAAEVPAAEECSIGANATSVVYLIGLPDFSASPLLATPTER